MGCNSADVLSVCRLAAALILLASCAVPFPLPARHPPHPCPGLKVGTEAEQVNLAYASAIARLRSMEGCARGAQLRLEQELAGM